MNFLASNWSKIGDVARLDYEVIEVEGNISASAGNKINYGRLS